MQTSEGAKKAAETKRQKAQTRIWGEVSRAKELFDCHCELHKGMDWDELRLVVGPLDCCYPRHICPVVDKYRRLVGWPKPPEEEEDE